MTSSYKIPSNYDEDQKKVISLDKGYNLVLAPPGCGKTDIIAERIARLHGNGVAFDDMLCLTFTNRAAREMQDRIKNRLGRDTDTSDLFVGNIHRYCSKFLFENNLIPLSTSILDDLDTYSIIRSLCKENKNRANYFNHIDKRGLERILRFQHMVFQIKSCHAEKAMMDYEDCLYYKNEDSRVHIDVNNLCEKSGMSIVELYDKIYDINHIGLFSSMRDTYYMFFIARKYEDYKKEFRAIDFDDILLLAYSALIDKNITRKYYHWIQVDEVQDLNPLQFAIIDELTAKQNFTTVYLGDEQQAIFSFIGAKMKSLELLKSRCDGKIYHLYKNYRSPKYLLDVLNHYAINELGVKKEFIPDTDFNPEPKDDDMVIDESPILSLKINGYAVDKAISITEDNDTTAIIVNSNKGAEEIGYYFKHKEVECFKMAGEDIFSSPELQVLISHLNIVRSELDILAWTKIFHYLKLFHNYSFCREFVKESLFDRCITPLDIIKYNNSSYVNEIAKAYDNDLIIFDTETTGLDVFNDDIVQIAAIRMREGEIIDKFNVFLETDRQIPEYLGNERNPLFQTHKNAQKQKREEGLKSFLNFVGSTPVLGHNVEYDYRILQFNIKRDCEIIKLDKLIVDYFDSLKLAKLVLPNLKQYKLESLIESLSLPGTNTHLAEDDVLATYELVKYCINKARDVLEKQKLTLSSNNDFFRKFRQIYTPIYNHTISALYDTNNGEKPALVQEFEYIYDYLISKEIFSRDSKFDHIMRFLEFDVIDKAKESSLYEQIQNHIKEINTFKEVDLCNSSTMKERFFVSTVHKAKGLEFDNVIVTNVIEGVYPFYKSNSDDDIKEDARKLYVAMSRAKKRLLLLSGKKIGANSFAKPSRFLQSIDGFFKHVNITENITTNGYDGYSSIASIPFNTKQTESNNKFLNEYNKIIEAFREKSIDSVDEIFNVFKNIRKKDPSYVLDYFKIGDEKYYRYDLYFHILNACYKYNPQKLIIRPAFKAFFSTVFTGKKHSIETRFSKFLDDMKIYKPMTSEEETSGIPDICNYLIVPFNESSLWQLVLLKELYQILPSDRKKYAPIYICSEDDIDKIESEELEHLTFEKSSKLREITRSKDILPTIKFENNKKAYVQFYYWKPKCGLVKMSYWVVKKGKSVKIKSAVKLVEVIYDKEFIDSDKIKYATKNTIERLLNKLTDSEGLFGFLDHSDIKYVLANTWCLMKYGSSFDLPDSVSYIYKLENNNKIFNEMQRIDWIVDRLKFDDGLRLSKGQAFIDDLKRCLNEIKEAYRTDDDYDFNYDRTTVDS